MTLKEQIQKALNVPEDFFSNHCSDLQILYNDEIISWLRANYKFMQNVEIHVSDVEGQSWYGKVFIEIPFAFDEYHSKRIKLIRGN